MNLDKIIRIEENNIEGAIFDLDGTLLDSMWVWDKVDFDSLGKRGIEVPNDYTREIAHMDAKRIARYTIDRFNLNDKEDDLINEWFEMAKIEYQHNVKCKPGATEYLKKLHRNGVKISIATSSDSVLFSKTLERTGIDKFINSVVMVKEVKHGKSHPDVYLEAARRMQVNPKKCVVFEDIMAGITSAKLGGFKTAAVYEKRSSEDIEKIKQQCDYYIESFENLL